MRFLALLFGLWLSSASLAAMACEHSTLPAIFDDRSRQTDRSIRAMNREMIRYVTEMGVYVSCLQDEYAAADADGAPPRHLSLVATRHNLAVDELEAVKAVYEEHVGPVGELLAGLVSPDGPQIVPGHKRRVICTTRIKEACLRAPFPAAATPQ